MAFAMFSARFADGVFTTARVSGPRISAPSTLTNPPANLMGSTLLFPYSIRYFAQQGNLAEPELESRK
jgi:hypothetical protein